MPNTNRNKGNNYERELAKEFRELGFSNCVTSRSESKRRDDAGVDLCYTGCLNVQAKAWKSAPSYHKILKEMPDEAGQHNVIFHKRPRQGDVVVMRKEDFYELILTLKKEKIW
tara:strand:- start:196 stop:534 length:339 start_codon:yes stop_codon:yes gene_type:complete